MIEREAQRLVVKVPMVMANARGLLDAGRSALQPGEQIFDLKQVGDAASKKAVKDVVALGTTVKNLNNINTNKPANRDSAQPASNRLRTLCALVRGTR